MQIIKKQLKFVSDNSVIYYWQKKRVIGGVIFVMDGATIGDKTRSVQATGFFVLLNVFHWDNKITDHITDLHCIPNWFILRSLQSIDGDRLMVVTLSDPALVSRVPEQTSSS